MRQFSHIYTADIPGLVVLGIERFTKATVATVIDAVGGVYHVSIATFVPFRDRPVPVQVVLKKEKFDAAVVAEESDAGDTAMGDVVRKARDDTDAFADSPADLVVVDWRHENGSKDVVVIARLTQNVGADKFFIFHLGVDGAADLDEGYDTRQEAEAAADDYFREISGIPPATDIDTPVKAG